MTVAEWFRAPDSSSGVFDQQTVGSIPGRGTCVKTRFMIASSFGRDSKPLVPFVVYRTYTNPVHLSQREGVRPGTTGLICCILCYNTL